MKLIALDGDNTPSYLQSIEDYDTYFLVRLKGDLNTHAIARDHDKMTEVIENAGLYAKSILCDFGGVADSDTATVAALIRRFAEFRKSGGGKKMVFFNIRGELKEIFNIAHLNELFMVRDTEQQAIAALNNQATS